jgi:hypothetical protein
MSGRIYDNGTNPICNECGSTMYTSHQRNFNGAKCKRNGCKGIANYTPYGEIKQTEYKTKSRYNKEGKLILEGIFTSFDKSKMTYTLRERFRNFLYNFKQLFKK